MGSLTFHLSWTIEIERHYFYILTMQGDHSFKFAYDRSYKELRVFAYIS